MRPTQVIFIILTVLLLAVGQVLFKLASKNIVLNFPSFISSLFNSQLIFALLVYGVATIFWLIALKTTPLRIAYPFMALAFFVTPILGHFILREPLNWNTFLGAFIIAIGVGVSVFK